MDNFFDNVTDPGRSGGAGLGLNLGIQYVYHLPENGLGLFVVADFNFNPLRKSVRDDIKDEYDSDIDIYFPKFINVPLSGGHIIH